MSQERGLVMTVRGPIPPADLGCVSMHEHVLSDFRGVYGKHARDEPLTIGRLGELRWNPMLLRDNLALTEHQLLVQELGDFKAAGGGTVVEMTNRGVGQDPLGLRELALASELNIVAAAGYYIEPSHPKEVNELSLDELAGRLADQISTGIDGTPVRAGLFGEIGTSAPPTLQELKVVRAVARAHKITGASISVHLDARGTYGTHVMRVIEQEGVDPARVVLGHCDEHLDPSYHRELLATGATLGFDTFGTDVIYSVLGFSDPSDVERMKALVALLDLGAADRIVLGQDVFLKQLLTRFGGMGYGHILRRIVPYLKRHFGVDDGTFRTLLVDNPARILPLST